MNLGKTFYANHLGTFYYDPETNEVTIRIEYGNTVLHEWRLEATVMIRQFSEAIPEIAKIMVKRFRWCTEGYSPQAAFKECPKFWSYDFSCQNCPSWQLVSSEKILQKEAES